MTGWFGQSWGAPCCDPEEHVPTPVGELCLRCGERIARDDQGVTTCCVESLAPLVARTRATHLDCYLKQILPHGPDCPFCRGRERDDHGTWCQYRMFGGECNCVGAGGRVDRKERI